MRINPTAEIEPGVEIGLGTSIESHVHARGPARIGKQCIVGEKTFIADGVDIGDRVNMDAFVYLCNGVVVEDAVMIGAGVVFTNDRYPRATAPDLRSLRESPGPDAQPTWVCGRARQSGRAPSSDRGWRSGASQWWAWALQ
jgi:UDP-2-acetamido-3-amino-2,3-dideoxy-glucuronate N-acetyltransferase